jgi:uncharacterized protein YcbK (DUF882 family)
VPVGTARPNTRHVCAARAGYSCALALLVLLFGCKGLQNAVADGDTRTISMHHVHTGEDITITYKRDGRYDEAALEKLNWFLRDWRRGKETRMDPRLIDLLWEVQRETGSKQPIDVVCGYRSPETNAMLRRRSRGVAHFSQHILGRAIDFYIPGVPLEQLREIGLRLQRGGVGFYPSSGSPFVHMDTGGVRMWPRMTRNQLLHVFPDGRTIYLPSDGRPLPGYALALADLRKRGQNPTETWSEEARQEGLDKNIVLASDSQERAGSPDRTYGMTAADRTADAREAARTAAPAAPAARPQAKDALLAALEREAERKRQEVRTAAVPRSNPSGNGAALYQTASYTTPAAGEAPQQVADLTPSEVISVRGFWDVPADGGAGAAAAQRGKALRANAARRQLLDSVADATGTIIPPSIPPSGVLEDRVAPGPALAYAEQPNLGAPAPPTVMTTRAAARPAPLPTPPAATTIAMKRSADQMTSTILGAPPRLPSAAGAGAQVDDPWLDAVMVSPSVRHYLTALSIGEQNYRALATLLQKPASGLLMTFAAEPNPGLTHDRFSGSAIVFLSIVTYQTAAHTALVH